MKLDALGFQVHFHAIGDRAVREALDSIEAARVANGPSDHRHHIAHIQVIHPDDVPRFAELDVTGNMQPLWACHEPQMNELTIPFLGEPRWRTQYPFGALATSRSAAGRWQRLVGQFTGCDVGLTCRGQPGVTPA